MTQPTILYSKSKCMRIAKPYFFQDVEKVQYAFSLALCTIDSRTVRRWPLGVHGVLKL